MISSQGCQQYISWWIKGPSLHELIKGAQGVIARNLQEMLYLGIEKGVNDRDVITGGLG